MEVKGKLYDGHEDLASTSRLLINGNGANKFLDNDLKNIHSIVLKSLKEQGVEGLSTEQLNRQSLLHKDNNSTIRTGTNKKQEVEEGNDTCTKCNQRCKTRSTYCDKGSHWVHYKCQKLSELEIQMAENSNGDEYYECKLCIAAKSNILALEGSTQSHTNAQLLLTEETEAKRGYNTDETLDTSPEEQNCTVCDNILMDPEWDICEQCNSKSHFKCMTEISTAYICIPCIMIEDELQPITQGNDKITASTGICNNTCIKSPMEKSRNKPTSVIASTTTKPKPIPKPRNLKQNQKSSEPEDTILPKPSELRARELKVRKAEEQLKIKEKSLKEVQNDRVLLESRCQQLEARNFELEQTVKLLKRRIESNSNLTIPTLTNTGEPKQGNTDSFQKMKEQLDEKLAKLHTKLSNIVIDEMDRQINKIRLFDDCPHISEERLKATQGTGDEKVPSENKKPQKENVTNTGTKQATQQLTGQPLFLNHIRQNIKEHWLFQTQIHLLGEIHENINYIGKGVDINEPLLPICMPRGYGGVAILWKKEIDHMIRPIELGSERIQCVEIRESNNPNIILTSVYLPAKGSKNHQAEYQDVIDQLYELYQKYNETHKIIIGGDLNEGLNIQTGTKRNLYLRDFIKECNLKYDNKERTFVNSLGQESSEIDYFLHNLPENEFDNKQVLNHVTENTSDHHPIRMSTKFTYESLNNSHAQNSSKIAKRVNWDKVDKEWYSVHINKHIDSLQIRENMKETEIEQATSKLCELLRETANLTSSSKAKFNAKPKLKVWTPEIQIALKIARQKYNVWKHHETTTKAT
ncbi:uncharacterized protein [Mytilus edulis]|uniref:uncharacterized protein n=1 Tax=Mytilus edulis TaxID=6550 RepID=UPI0039EE4C0F